jgi:hypothetical protein
MILAMDGFDGIHSLKDGIYIGGFNMNHLISEHILHEYPFSPWMWKENRTLPDEERIKLTLFDENAPHNYGVCDDYHQILERWPEIESSERKFIICLTPIIRTEQPSSGGWRWHKWGTYIGDHEITAEYIYDCKDVIMVYCFHIYEII